MLVDYIDESNLQASNRSGSINKLEDFLKTRGIDIDFSVLRNLQTLRSAGVAHSKGAKYEKQKNMTLSGDMINDIERMIIDLTSFMKSLRDAIENS
jgi:hypothetical protein